MAENVKSRRSGRLVRQTFAIVIETENLALEGSGALLRCLKSLQGQQIDLAAAHDIVVVNCGQVTTDLKEELSSNHPYLRVLELPAETGYYDAKMQGAASAIGEIVVFCDSDVEYDSRWLAAMLEPFDQSSDVEFVCGQTSYRITGPYSLALLLSFRFPPFSARRRWFPCTGYAANAFAMRRSLLQRVPIPTKNGISHGNCRMHADQMLSDGVVIWKQPSAKAFHPLLRPDRFLVRFFLGGHHAWLRYMTISRERRARRGVVLSGLLHFAQLLRLAARQLLMPVYRLPGALGSGWCNLLFLPLALPLVIVANTFFVAGLVATVFAPRLDLSGWTDRS